jgi:hypothetical protein
MAAILMEGVLFVAIIAAMAALLFYGVVTFTPLGSRLRGTRNRKRLERELALTCPLHGAQREEEMVRLPSGDLLCPVCYKEAIHD